jgi:hypothetical protein
MDIIPLNAALIKGSHGRVFTAPEFYPLIITNKKSNKEKLLATDVYSVIWESLGLH